MSTSKFKGITYPFFALKKVPFEIVYSLAQISIRKTPNSHLETVDNKDLSGDYFARLVQLDRRVAFDFTCKTLQDLIYCKAVWGVDSNAIPHDLLDKERFTTKVAKVQRVIGDLIWLRGISYPFTLHTTTVLELQGDLYATIVNIDNEWYIREFTYEPKTLQKLAIL